MFARQRKPNISPDILLIKTVTKIHYKQSVKTNPKNNFKLLFDFSNKKIQTLCKTS